MGCKQLVGTGGGAETEEVRVTSAFGFYFDFFCIVPSVQFSRELVRLLCLGDVNHRFLPMPLISRCKTNQSNSACLHVHATRPVRADHVRRGGEVSLQIAGLRVVDITRKKKHKKLKNNKKKLNLNQGHGCLI